MSERFTLNLPRGTAPADVAAIKEAVRGAPEVEASGTLDVRGVDPATVGLWVQTAATAVGVAGGALALVERIVHLVRGRNIKGATIQVGDAKIDVDRASASELKAILKAARG